MFQNCVRAKPSYQAPEMHAWKAYDSFLAESFSVGVLLYGLFVKEQPWLSTKPGVCINFQYAQAKGFRAFIKKRKVRGTDKRVMDVLSEPLVQLLEGMLASDPKERLTFGEAEYLSQRSVWDEAWMKEHGMQQDTDSQTLTQDSEHIPQESYYKDCKHAKMPSGHFKMPSGHFALDARMQGEPGMLPKHIVQL